MSGVAVRDLVVRFGERTILNGVSLDVAPGTLTAVMGSSGGGKTTLLRAIAGLGPISSGSATVDGVDVARDPEGARDRLGLVFQQSALFDFLNVRDNLLFAPRRRGVRRKGEAEIVARALEEVGLPPDTATKMPAELSGGMRKRVGIARAIALEPRVILYDEPTTGLDPITTFLIDGLMRRTVDERGATALVVSHDLASVYRIADRVAFLHRGDLAFEGTPAEFDRAEHEAIRELREKSVAHLG